MRASSLTLCKAATGVCCGQAAGRVDWYKPREALMFGLGCNWNAELQEKMQAVGLDFASFMEAIVQYDLNDDALPLLKGRAFWFVAR